MPTPSKPASSHRATNAATSGSGRPTGTRIATRSRDMLDLSIQCRTVARARPATYPGPGGTRRVDHMHAGERLAEFVAASQWGSVPEQVRHEGKRSLLNFLGC